MVIYVDVLVFTNIIIDYILLYLTAKFTNKTYKLARIVLASCIGGITSLYIFINVKLLIVDFLFKIVMSVLIVCVAFGFSRIRILFYTSVLYLTLSFAFCGLIIFLQNIRPELFLNRNLMSYLNISPVFLVILTAIFYIIIKLLFGFVNRKSNAQCVELDIKLSDFNLSTNALVDSGHTLKDPLSDAEIFILNSKNYELFEESGFDLVNRIRLIPVKTVSGSCLLRGIRCDAAIIKLEDREIHFNKPIILKSNQDFCDDYGAIVSKLAII